MDDRYKPNDSHKMLASKNEFHLPLRLNSNSIGFTHSFDDSLYITEGRMRASEQNYESMKQSLLQQLDLLKQQASIKEDMHNADLRKLQEENKQVIETIEKSKAAKITQLKKQIETQQNRLAHANTKTSHLRESIQATMVDFQLQKAEEESAITHLKAQIEEYTSLLNNCSQREYAELNRLKDQETACHQEALTKLSDDQTKWLEHKRKQLEARDVLAANLEQEILVVRRKIKEIEGFSTEQVAVMQKNLTNSTHSLSTHKKDIKQLRRGNDQCMAESALLASESALLRDEIRRVQRENIRMKEQILKLEKLVYGNRLSRHK